MIPKMKTKLQGRNYIKFPPEEVFRTVEENFSKQDSNWKKSLKTSYPFKSTFFAGTDKNISKTPKVGTRPQSKGRRTRSRSSSIMSTLKDEMPWDSTSVSYVDAQSRYKANQTKDKTQNVHI